MRLASWYSVICVCVAFADNWRLRCRRSFLTNMGQEDTNKPFIQEGGSRVDQPLEFSLGSMESFIPVPSGDIVVGGSGSLVPSIQFQSLYETGTSPDEGAQRLYSTATGGPILESPVLSNEPNLFSAIAIRESGLEPTHRPCSRAIFDDQSQYIMLGSEASASAGIRNVHLPDQTENDLSVADLTHTEIMQVLMTSGSSSPFSVPTSASATPTQSFPESTLTVNHLRHPTNSPGAQFAGDKERGTELAPPVKKKRSCFKVEPKEKKMKASNHVSADREKSDIQGSKPGPGLKASSRSKVPLPVKKAATKRKPRTYSKAIPSQHCHVCSRRPTIESPHVSCGNLIKGKCRKTVCKKCFMQYGWDMEVARNSQRTGWVCSHCVGNCPRRAQCHIYDRTSERRRNKAVSHRPKKAQSLAAVALHESPVEAFPPTGAILPGRNPSTLPNLRLCLATNSLEPITLSRAQPQVRQPKAVKSKKSPLKKPRKPTGVEKAKKVTASCTAIGQSAQPLPSTGGRPSVGYKYGPSTPNKEVFAAEMVATETAGVAVTKIPGTALAANTSCSGAAVHPPELLPETATDFCSTNGAGANRITSPPPYVFQDYPVVSAINCSDVSNSSGPSADTLGSMLRNFNHPTNSSGAPATSQAGIPVLQTDRAADAAPVDLDNFLAFNSNTGMEDMFEGYMLQHLD